MTELKIDTDNDSPLIIIAETQSGQLKAQLGKDCILLNMDTVIKISSFTGSPKEIIIAVGEYPMEEKKYMTD